MTRDGARPITGPALCCRASGSSRHSEQLRHLPQSGCLALMSGATSASKAFAVGEYAEHCGASEAVASWPHSSPRHRGYQCPCGRWRRPVPKAGLVHCMRRFIRRILPVGRETKTRNVWVNSSGDGGASSRTAPLARVRFWREEKRDKKICPCIHLRWRYR